MSAGPHVVVPEQASEAVTASQTIVNRLRESVQSIHGTVDASRQRLNESYVLLAHTVERLPTSLDCRSSVMPLFTGTATPVLRTLSEVVPFSTE